MTTEIEVFEAMMDLLQDQKIIIIQGPEFILSPSFTAVLISSFSQHPFAAATGLALAIKSYCPDIKNIQLALAATGVMKVLQMTDNPLFHEVKTQLDRDIPADSVSKEFMGIIADRIKEAHQKK